MTDRHPEAESLGRLLVEMEIHIAFLESALGPEMTLMAREDEVILSELSGLGPGVPCRLMFSSRTAASGYMDDTMVFKTFEDLVTFLEHVVLLFRVARAQQRGE